MARKSPVELPPHITKAIAEIIAIVRDPPGRYRGIASILARKVPGIDAEAMAEGMAEAGRQYELTLSIQWEGGRRKVVKAVTTVAVAAESLLNAINQLGPQGNQIALGSRIGDLPFLLTEHGQWLHTLACLKGPYEGELKDRPEGAGRPPGSTDAQRNARYTLLLSCFRICEPFMIGNEDTVLTLIPKMAKAIHRIICDPKLSKTSQLFRKEWDALRRSEISLDSRFSEHF